MNTREHIWISALVFGTVEGVLGGILTDVMFIPITIHDYLREKEGKPFKELSNFWVKMNWFFHSVWFVVFLFFVCSLMNHLVFWRAYVLHIILDVCTHTGDVAIKLWYPLSDSRVDVWRSGYVKSYRGIYRKRFR